MRTIRQRLTRKLLLAFVLLLLLAGIGVYFSTRAALLEQFNATLRAKAGALSSATEQRGKRIEMEFSDQFMRGFDDGVATDFFQIRQLDGTTVRRSQSLASANLPSRFGTVRRPRFWNLILPSGRRGRAIGYTFSPRNVRNELSETAQLGLVVASDRSELDENLAALSSVILGGGALILVATIVIVPRVLRHELAPLNQLADQASCINADSLSTRFPTNSLPGELKPISERLNDLLSRLEQSFRREREFSADLAHELRTPIAELRSLAELALKWPDSRPAETDRDMLAIALQMQGIVVRLLELLRSERGQLSAVREGIALAPLIKNVWLPFVKKAAEKQMAVSLNVADDVQIESDPVLLRSILNNLAENAVEYSPCGGMLRLECSVDGGRFIVRFINTVEHLNPDHLPRYFDRFWRNDSARAGNNHSGLGLSLARAFAQALDCELTAALDGESQLAFTLSGPVVMATPKTCSVQS